MNLIRGAGKLHLRHLNPDGNEGTREVPLLILASQSYLYYCNFQSVELEKLAVYLDSDITPWHITKPWDDLQPSEWDQVFSFGTKDGRPANALVQKHTYVLQPVTGNAKYSKQRSNSSNRDQPLQKAAVSLDDVTISLSKSGYRDVLKLADNFSAFNERLKYAHFRPLVPVKSDPRSWWKYACRVVSDQIKKASLMNGVLIHLGLIFNLPRVVWGKDSDITPWHITKPWDDLQPSEWDQVFSFGTKDGKPANALVQKHTYSGYRDVLKLADNFSAFNERLKYAHFRPLVPVKSDPRSWWKYACRVVSDQIKKASGRTSWEQVLKMLAHKFFEKSQSDIYLKKQNTKKSWWSFGWNSGPVEDDNQPRHFTDEDWKQLNEIIGYKEGDDSEQLLLNDDRGDVLHTLLEVHMKHNASRLTEAHEFVAELSCENLDCLMKFYKDAKVFDMKLGSYRLSSPDGLLAESATSYDSLVGVFRYKPFDAKVDWSMVAKASPCYVTYLKNPVDQIINFFESNAAVSQKMALETAAAVQVL
uniref:Chorein N-terminal domain-containing protein n=1 Tax=Tanacetum cinerariifolium TaxID=118510 RepID=A0A6L2LJ31_TANCI|nr:hypothetical protein [Tanacetum cinerariifolium]